jgi:hypothetical protein
MTRNADRKAAIRRYQADHPGMSYAEAARHLDTTTAAVATMELPIEEQGVRALPADATPEQRARAEATWRPAWVGEPCRCSGHCHHGTPCDTSTDPGRCTGRMVHVDRYPGGVFHLTLWQDEYVCATCEEEGDGSVTLPDLPWGQVNDSAITVFDGVRHPAFRDDTDPDNDGFDDDLRQRYCNECGADSHYACHC